MYLMAAILIISILLNAVLIWYIRKMLSHLLHVSDNLGDLVESTVVFSEHLNDLHAAEMYYGDQTLQNLIKHSRALVAEMKDFSEVYNLVEDRNDAFEGEFQEEQE